MLKTRQSENLTALSKFCFLIRTPHGTEFVLTGVEKFCVHLYCTFKMSGNSNANIYANSYHLQTQIIQVLAVVIKAK